MSKQCGNSDCVLSLQDLSADWVKCNGLCGKSFHALCIGLSKRSTAYLSDYNNNFLFFCDECKGISLSHVMLAIKCVSDTLNANSSDCKMLHKQIVTQFAKYDDLVKCVEEISTSIDLSTTFCKTKFKNIDKQLASLSELTKKSPAEFKSKLLNLKSDIKSDINSILSPHLITIDDHLNSFRSYLDTYLQSSSKPTAPPHQPVDPLMFDIISKISDVSNDFAALRVVMGDIDENIRLTSNKIDLIPELIQPQSSSVYNTSILAEIRESTEYQTSPIPQPTTTTTTATTTTINTTIATPKTSSTVPIPLPPTPPAIPRLPLSSAPVTLPAPPTVAPRTLIKHFGTTWTHSDWQRRINKLESENLTTLFIKGAPQYADISWIKTFFTKRFGITISHCKMFNHKSNRKFKLDLPAKYEWLFLRSAGDILNLGKMSICKWSEKPSNAHSNKISKSVPSNNNNKPSNKISRPIPNSRPKPDPNWSLKTKLFPNFAPPTNIPNNPPSCSLNVSKPSKAPRNRVSFRLTPTSNTISSTPSTIPSTNNSFPNFDLTTGAKYPNFISSHFINPTSNTSTKPPSSTSTSSTPSPTTTTTTIPFLDPLLPPLAKLTQQTFDSTECRYALSRLREKKTYENTRLFLAYLHDKSDSVCYEGKTKTSVMVSIQQEGLPTDLTSLRNIYTKFHESFNISAQKVVEDLNAFGNFVHSKRISHLQRSRVDHNTFFRP